MLFCSFAFCVLTLIHFRVQLPAWLHLSVKIKPSATRLVNKCVNKDSTYFKLCLKNDSNVFSFLHHFNFLDWLYKFTSAIFDWRVHIEKIALNIKFDYKFSYRIYYILWIKNMIKAFELLIFDLQRFTKTKSAKNTISKKNKDVKENLKQKLFGEICAIFLRHSDFFFMVRQFYVVWSFEWCALKKHRHTRNMS